MEGYFADYSGYDIRKLRIEILQMVWPVAVESLLQMMVGLVSMSIVGHIDAISVGAVGLTNRITMFIWAILNVVVTGTVILVSQSFGSGDKEKVKDYAETGMILGLISILIISILAFYFARLIIHFFGAQDELFLQSVKYLKIITFSLPFMMIIQVGSSIFRGIGNTKTPMYIALCVNLLNLIWGFVLVFGKLGFPKLGLVGAGIATVISQVIGALIYLYLLGYKQKVLTFSLNIKYEHFSKMMRLGIPTSLESLFWQVAHVILTIIVVSFGSAAFAAHQLGMQAESISYTPAFALSIAVTTLVGQSIGANDIKKARLYIKEVMIWVLAVTMVAVMFLLLIPARLMSLLTSDKEVIAYGAKYLILMGLAQIPQNITFVINGAFRASGDTKTPMFVAGIGLWFVRIVFAVLFTKILHMGVVSVWFAMTLDLYVRFLLISLLYRKSTLFHKTDIKVV